MKNTKINIIVALTLISVLSVGFNVSADPASTPQPVKTEQTAAAPTLQQTMNNGMNLLGNLDPTSEKQVDDSINTVNAIDSEMSKLTIDITNNQSKLTALQVDIDSNKVLAEKKKAELAVTVKLRNKRARSLYINNADASYISSILSGGSISEVSDRFFLVERVIAYDKEIFDKAERDEKEIESTLAKLEDDKSKIVKLTDSLLKKTDELKTSRSQALLLISKLNAVVLSKETDADAQSLEAQYASNYRGYKFSCLTSLGAGSVGSTALDLSSSNLTRSDIVMYTASFLGIPYVWGGTEPSGFDCSGLTMYVYNRFGIQLPRVSEDQQNVGTEITDSTKLLPGDLLFYGDPAHHVTMYISPGYMIEAPHTGDVVKVSRIRPFTHARRIVKLKGDTN